MAVAIGPAAIAPAALKMTRRSLQSQPADTDGVAALREGWTGAAL